jgi:hypothetical protein
MSHSRSIGLVVDFGLAYSNFARTRCFSGHWGPSRNVRVFVGYIFRYISDVVRPGDQIDPRVNSASVGSKEPMPLFNLNDFYAQGITFGVMLKF